MATRMFEPELGQMLLSHTAMYKFEMQDHVESGLRLLGDFLVERGLCNHSPADNTAAGYENSVLAMRAYCWCDGDLHKEGCPDNFECGDFSASWYKYLGRGSSQSRRVTVQEWMGILNRCMDSVR